MWFKPHISLSPYIPILKRLGMRYRNIWIRCFQQVFFPPKNRGPHQCDSYLASIFNLLFSENRIQFSLYKHKNRETSFRWFQKTQNQFSDNLVNKLRSFEVHIMCCLNQTQRIRVSLTLKISPKQ